MWLNYTFNQQIMSFCDLRFISILTGGISGDNLGNVVQFMQGEHPNNLGNVKKLDKYNNILLVK